MSSTAPAALVVARGVGGIGPGRVPPARELGFDVAAFRGTCLTLCSRAGHTGHVDGMEQSSLGRPPKALEAKRSYRTTVRLTPASYRQLIDGASEEGETLSTYILSRLEM